MAKQSRLEDIQTNKKGEYTELEGENANIFIEFIEKFGDNVALISGIPADTKIKELNIFLNKYDQNHYILYDKTNGKELRQAFALISSQKSYQNLLSQKQLFFKSTFILIEKCTQQLKEVWKINLELNQINNIERKQLHANNLYQNGTLQHFNQILVQLNTLRYEYKEQNGIWPSLSMDDLFITKNLCFILHFIIVYNFNSRKSINNIGIHTQLMNLINSLSLHEINRSHSLFLKAVIVYGSDEIKSQLMNNQGIQIFARLLEHSNIQVKDDAINSIYNILDINESRIDMRDEHPQYSEIKNNGIIHLIFLNCIINGEQEEMKSIAAIILGTLLRAQELDSYLKGKLISQLKQDIISENTDQYIEKGLNVLCGLAMKESNISEIISDNFIKVVIAHSNSIVDNIKSYSLELLLLLAENGGYEVEQLIRNQIDSLQFMELIGNWDLDLDI